LNEELHRNRDAAAGGGRRIAAVTITPNRQDLPNKTGDGGTGDGYTAAVRSGHPAACAIRQIGQEN
jgi:hypothetical protein